jgi:hypothetical protein
MMTKVKSLGDLRSKAQTDKRYEKLAIAAAENLGKKCDTLDKAMRWLETNAMETDEDGVVDEINFVRDCI